MIELLRDFVELKRKKKYNISFGIEIFLILICIFIIYKIIICCFGYETGFPDFVNRFLVFILFIFVYTSLNYFKIIVQRYNKKNYYKNNILENFQGFVLSVSDNKINVVYNRNVYEISKEEIENFIPNFNINLIEKNDILYIIFEMFEDNFSIKRISSIGK